MLKNVYKDKNLLAIVKPAGMPAEPDKTGARDAMTLCAEALSAFGERPELYLVHRLDLPVGGLMVFARNKRSAAELSAMFAADGVTKEYLAVTEGDCPEGIFNDYLKKNATLGKAAVCREGDSGAKRAELYCETLDSKESEKGTRTLVRVRLKTGRFHQIRAQLSSRGAPLVGDKKYGGRDVGCRTPALFCHRLSFTLFSEEIRLSALPDTTAYPWSLFDKKNFEETLK